VVLEGRAKMFKYEEKKSHTLWKAGQVDFQNFLPSFDLLTLKTTFITLWVKAKVF